MDKNSQQNCLEKSTEEKRRISKIFENVSEKDLYLMLFEETLTDKGLKIDHSILQQKCEFETEASVEAELIHGEELTESVLMPSVASSKTEAIQRNLAETQHKHKLFYNKLFDGEQLLQLQEERRKEAETEIENLRRTTDEKKRNVEILFQKGLDVQNDTRRIKKFVEASKVYKDYVERSIPLWEKEAKGVHDICSRFRDLLTLRFQLLTKVIEAFDALKETRMKHQEMIKTEDTEEGKALLDIYRYKTSLRSTNKAIETAEAELKTLRNNSIKIVTDLTRVQLALTNMYNVACRFQSALPPLDPGAEPIVVLEQLHNFIIDATQVLKITEREADTDSLKVNKGSK